MKKAILLILILVLSVIMEEAKANITFGEPTLIGPPVAQGTEHGASISANGLELYFDGWTQGQMDIFLTTRGTTDDGWGEAISLGEAVNSTAFEWTPRISADGLELYFASSRIGSLYSGFQIYVAHRQSTEDDWQPAKNLGDMINSSYEQTIGSISANGLELYYSSGDKMYVATRVSKDSAWTEKKAIAPTIFGNYPSISPDGSHLFFSGFFPSSLPGGMGDDDIWMMTRTSANADWSAPINLGPIINSQDKEHIPWISHDGATLLFTLGGVGGDRYQAEIIPPLGYIPVDINGDGIVDSADMCIMIDHWATDNTLCDIAPLISDGIVDVLDLIVLSEHLFEKVIDPTLVVHWALDETEGMFATDSVGDNDALVVGGATWQSDGGQVDGALQLNGVDGCAITGPALNPADVPFSIIAWIKGGAPGQVTISQQAMANWLAVDAEGNLMTELKSSDLLASPLISETVITDEQWHRIGLVWDGSHRMLYVDGVKVAEDIQPGLEDSKMGLYIGVDKFYAPETFWSGLIDDVRVYNRIVSP